MARRHASPMRHSISWPSTKASREIAAAHGLQLGQRQQRRRHRRGRMDRGRHMGIAEVEDIGAGGIEERCIERIDALAPADDRRLLAAGKRRSDASAIPTSAAAGQRHGEEIQQRAFGLMRDRRRQFLPPGPTTNPASRSVTLRLMQHGFPAHIAGEDRPPRAKVQGCRK